MAEEGLVGVVQLKRTNVVLDQLQPLSLEINFFFLPLFFLGPNFPAGYPFVPVCLRTPTDIARLLYVGQQRGFLRILGTLDCMHWKWKNCPMAWTRQYAGRSGSPTIIFKTVADYNLWIWHAYFGMSGTNNDINVLESSHFFF